MKNSARIVLAAGLILMAQASAKAANTLAQAIGRLVGADDIFCKEPDGSFARGELQLEWKDERLLVRLRPHFGPNSDLRALSRRLGLDRLAEITIALRADGCLVSPDGDTRIRCEGQGIISLSKGTERRDATALIRFTFGPPTTPGDLLINPMERLGRLTVVLEDRFFGQPILFNAKSCR